MRLPENKNDRIKALVLIAIAGLGVLYGLWMFIYEPLRQGRDEALAEIDVLEDQLHAARIQVRRMREMETDLIETTAALKRLSEQHMLHPRLGNYLLRAREMILEQAPGDGLQAREVEERGRVDLPRRPEEGGEGYRVRAYAVQVTARCGYDTLREWVRTLEEQNPLLTLSEMMIMAEPEDPLHHRVRFEVHWPVWIDPEMRETVRRMAAEPLGEDTE